MSGSPPIFRRLAGLETEYAVAIHLSDSTAQGPTRWEAYERVLACLARRIPVVPAFHLKEGAFLATGGAVWFEAERLSSNGGLIEGATPECRSPAELVACQRAQDRLLEEAAEKASYDCQIRLIKNDRDALGNVYGAQENYDAEFARGFSLILWRAGLVALLPFMLLTWLATGVVFLGTMLYEYVAVGLLVPLGEIFVPSGAVSRWLLGADRIEQRPWGAPWPAWAERTLLWCYAGVTAPLACLLYFLVLLTGFRAVRRKLVPFLVSRPILSGSGMLDGDSRFLLADKAPAINGILGYGGFLNGRPLILLGGFFKVLSLDSLFAPQDYLDLFAPRQRLQIGLGDSNLCELAEYLRVGTTMLVLDCLEAGELPEPPRLLHPIASLRTVCADTEFSHALPTHQGNCTPTQLQRFYCNACRRFLSRHAAPPQEAWKVLELWEQTLDQLETEPHALIGTLDWVTKRYLLEHAPPRSSWETLKKIDLKYHELSAHGYHRLVAQELGPHLRLVDEEQLARYMRLPPSNTPATMRGRLVREFSTGDEPLAVNWKMVRIGRGPSARTYRLSDYHDGVSLQNGAVAGQERSSGEPVDHPDHDHEDG